MAQVSFAYLTERYREDQEATTGTELYYAYSFQACPLDPANPAFFIRARKTSFREWGKNKQAAKAS